MTEATCQQGAPCGDPDNCPDPIGCGFLEATAMNSPLDWDYADIKRRMEEINKPLYTSASGTAGNHCDHCPNPIYEHCIKSCKAAYRERFGVEPP